jgi:hypothetical protein
VERFIKVVLHLHPKHGHLNAAEACQPWHPCANRDKLFVGQEMHPRLMLMLTRIQESAARAFDRGQTEQSTSGFD